MSRDRAESEPTLHEPPSLPACAGIFFFGAYEKASSLLWASGAWGKRPEMQY